MAKPADPYAVTLSTEDRADLVAWLCTEISAAADTRPTKLSDVEYWHTLYEQGRTRSGKAAPWAGAADLTSYIATEKVDALRARIMKTIFSDPVYTVEGWGASSQRAPFVEEFLQWKVEEGGLQRYLSDVIDLSLKEPRGVLEVYEDTETRTTRRTINAALELTPDGRPILDAAGQWTFQTGEDGKFVEVGQDVPSAETVADAPERVRVGPAFRVVPYRDFLVLPAHAHDKRDIWGYAKRFTRRWLELKQAAKRGMYDRDQVEALTSSQDVSSAQTLSGTAIPVTTGATQHDVTVEKELWEVLFLYDFDGKGSRWYTATVQVDQRIMLRLAHDHLGARYVMFLPYPRPGLASEGYSLIGHKLLTLIEEHTAQRNTIADRSALVASAPIKRLETALWDPDEQPFGPGAVITVRDMREVEPMVIPDLTAPTIDRERTTLQASERLSGINDVALGQIPQESRTLGEVNLVAEQSFVRMEEITRNLQESLEDLAQILIKIWRNTLAEGPGVDMPERMLLGLEARTQPMTEYATGTKITADMLQGTFRYKPRGSVETADTSRQRSDFVQFLQVLPQLLMGWPALGAAIQGNPQAAKAMLAQAIRLFRIPDKQAFLGEAAQSAMQQAMQPPPPAMPGAPPVGPGGPPQGAPGLPGAVPGMPPGMPTTTPAQPQAGGPMA